MDTFVIILISISLFFLSYSWFLFCSRKNEVKTVLGNILKNVSSPIILLGLIGCILSFAISSDDQNILFTLPVWSLIVPFLSGAAFILLSKTFPSDKAQFGVLLCLCLLNVFLLPTDFSLTNHLLPWYAERLLLAMIWCLLALFYNILNGLEGLVSFHSLSVCFGLAVLSIVGMMPILYGYYNCIFIALFLGLMFVTGYPSLLTLSSQDARLIGFFIGWLGILATIEGNGSCFVILSMYYIYEMTTSLLKKLSFQKQFQRLDNNTFYAQLTASGVSPKQIYGLVSRISTIMILMSFFQIYAPNNYTLIILSFFMVFWVKTKIMQPSEKGSLLLTSNIFSLLKKSKKHQKTSRDD